MFLWFSMSPAGGTMTTQWEVTWPVETCIYNPIEMHSCKAVDFRFSIFAALTCRPMMLRPSLSFSGAKRRCCFSAYFTPMSYLEWKPLDLAWETERKMVVIECIIHNHIVFIILLLLPYCNNSPRSTKHSHRWLRHVNNHHIIINAHGFLKLITPVRADCTWFSHSVPFSGE